MVEVRQYAWGCHAEVLKGIHHCPTIGVAIVFVLSHCLCFRIPYVCLFWYSVPDVFGSYSSGRACLAAFERQARDAIPYALRVVGLARQRF